MSPPIRNLLHWLAHALCAAALTNCTLLSDFDVNECSTSADCDVLTEGIRRCEAGRCVSGCGDNAHCVSVDPRFPLCPRVGAACVALADAAQECSVASGYDPRELGPLTLESID